MSRAGGEQERPARSATGESDGARRMALVTVIGAGTMGHGIAQVAALAGYRVHLADTDPQQLQRALVRIRKNVDEGVARGKVAEGDASGAMDRLVPAADPLAAVADADLVVEAVPERLDLKQRLFRELESRAPPDALLATNTSSLSITEIQAPLERPGRLIGLHFFNPVHIIKLVEVVRGRTSAESAVTAGTDFVRSLGKEPIVVNDAPGFASSRLGIALGLEAMRMVDEGVASAEDIDKAMELGYRHPMGPLRLTDLVGLDVRLDIARYLHEKLGGDRFEPPAILERLVAEGRLGKKTGQGFYRWED